MEAYNPITLEELVANLGQLTVQSKLLAGGTDLIIKLNQENSGTQQLTDKLLYLGNLADLQTIKIQAGSLEIGSAVTMAEIATSSVIPSSLNGLKEAAANVGSVQIRNQATIGGNLAGASPAADLIPVLFLLKAKVILINPLGQLCVKEVADLIIGAGRNKLAYNEAIIKVIIPLPQGDFHSAFRKVGFRSKMTVARLTAALGWAYNSENRIGAASLYLGAIDKTPIACKEVEILLGTLARQTNLEIKLKQLSEEIGTIIAKTTAQEFDRDYKVKAIYGLMQDFEACLRL